MTTDYPIAFGAHKGKPTTAIPTLSIPRRLNVMHAIYTSNLDASLRPVALAFAWFANDDGGNVWPAISTVSRMIRWSERTIQRRLLTLLKLGVLELEDPLKGRSGGMGKTARYRFNLEILAQLPVEVEASVEPRQPRHPFPLSKPRQPRHPLRDQRVTGETTNPDTSIHKPRHVDPSNGDTVVTRSYIEPVLTNIEQTDADASGDSQRWKPIPFKVYAAIAAQALETSLRADKTDDSGNVIELFKQACAQHRPESLPYDGELARKAVDAARHSRDKAAGEFREKFKAVAHLGRVAQ